MSSGNLQGWSADPFGLHEERYFSLGRPTKLVRDGRVESYDEPPSGSYAPARAMAVDSVPGPRPAAVSGTPAGGAPRPVGGGARLATGAPWPAAQGPGPASLNGSPPPGRYAPAGPPRLLRPSVLVAVVALAVLTVAGVMLKASESGSPRTQAASPAAFVTQSAHRTLAQSTADLTLSGTLQVAGRSVPLSGAGETDFRTGASALNVDFSFAGLPVTEREVLVGGNLYETVSIGGKSISRETGGREWIQLPVGQSGNLSGAAPTSPLAALEQPGLAVQELGSATIGGVVCTGYAVTPTRQAMLAGAREESARLGLSSAMTSQLSSMMAETPPPTYRVWFDAQGLLREMDLSWQMTALGTLSFSATVNVSHYGSPVQITAPAPSDVISESALLQIESHSSAFCLGQC